MLLTTIVKTKGTTHRNISVVVKCNSVVGAAMYGHFLQYPTTNSSPVYVYKADSRCTCSMYVICMCSAILKKTRQLRNKNLFIINHSQTIL